MRVSKKYLVRTLTVTYGVSLTSMSSSSQLLNETVGATEVASGAVGAALRPIGPSNIWARSEGSGSGATGGAVGAVVGGGANGAARVSGSACVAVFPGSGPESSSEEEERQEYAEEVALAEEQLALLAFPCHRPANPAHRTPAGVPATASTVPRGADETKRPSQLLDGSVGATKPPSGTAGAAPGPVGSSNIWARSEGSGSGATGGAVGAVDGAARVGGGAGEAGSSGWTRPGKAVMVGAGGKHGAEAGPQA